MDHNDTPLDHMTGYGEAYFLGPQIELYLADDDSIEYEIAHATTFAENDFTPLTVPFLEKSKISSRETTDDSILFEANLSFDLSLGMAGVRFSMDDSLAMWFCDKLHTSLTLGGGHSGLISNAVQKCGTTITLHSDELATITMTIDVHRNDYGIRAGRIDMEMLVPNNMDTDAKIYSFRQLASLWAICHSTTLTTLEAEGSARKWGTQKDEKLRLVVGESTRSRFSYTDLALSNAIGFYRDLDDSAAPYATPTIGYIDTTMVHDAEAELAHRIPNEAERIAFINNSISKLVLKMCARGRRHEHPQQIDTLDILDSLNPANADTSQ